MHCLPSMPKVISNKEILAGGEVVHKYKISHPFHPFSFSKMWVPRPSALPALSIYPSAKNKDPLRADKRHMKQSCHHYCTQGRHNQSITVLRYFSVTLCRQTLGTDESCYGPSPGTAPSLQQKNQFIRKPRQKAKFATLSPLLSPTAHSLAAPSSSQPSGMSLCVCLLSPSKHSLSAKFHPPSRLLHEVLAEDCLSLQDSLLCALTSARGSDSGEGGQAGHGSTSLRSSLGDHLA